ncbi:MAG: ABC transporter ATP-binding protein [Propionibacteriaceae bacterium]|nr:ABC transporter ATP-binding protein [Propionibacteriaceae bacterium]
MPSPSYIPRRSIDQGLPEQQFSSEQYDPVRVMPEPGDRPAVVQPIAHVAANVPVVSVNQLVKVYGAGDTRVVALDGVSAQFLRGTFTAVMGPSGSGKSTLMHCLAGLDKPTSGQVVLAGQDLVALNDNKLTMLRRDQVGFIFQSFNLLPTHTARQNIVLPLELAGKKPDATLLDVIVTSLGLQDRLGHLPSQLSGGEQQRVAVARALITRPAVVVADEPTGALDSARSGQLLSYLRDAARQGQTIIMVTHDPTAASHADRALILSDGHIVDDIEHPDADKVLAAIGHLGGE